MRNHVLRPLWVALGVIALVLIARHLMVPEDFGVNGKNFTYGFYRASNVDEWKEFPLKYRGKAYCQECHEEKYEENMSSKHGIIECENCHGPALGHPENPEALAIDRSRALCLRCHADLAYPSSQRSEIPGINPKQHNPDTQCSECHNPHKPSLEDM
ncbi:MAG: cytochrome c3 family protein [Proteobacteria bacterium]|nr:cytochrome c3 family protein [Pseudomonadota bacterium]MBU1708705.1 cytochrome c3 family protein [Pseudomonadota bacterium]